MTTLDLAALIAELRRIADTHIECCGCDEEKVFRSAADRLEAAECENVSLKKQIDFLEKGQHYE